MDGTTATADDYFDQALLEESAKKSGLLWVLADGVSDGARGGARGGAAQSRPLWHAWHDGAVVLVGDGAEQPLHGLTAGAGAA